MPTEAAAELTVRRASPEDAIEVADLYTAARVAAVPQMPPAVHTNGEDRAWMAGQLGSDEIEAWVACLPGGAIAAYALVTPTWLDHLFVHPAHLGAGIGSMLLDLVKSLRPHGFCLWVFETNTGARRFYARHGLLELEHTDGSGNEERAPDVRMAWPGERPLGFLRGLIDEVDDQLGDLLARRAALTRAVQGVKPGSGRDETRERAIAEALAERAPALGVDRLAGIVDAIVSASLDAAAEGSRDH